MKPDLLRSLTQRIAAKSSCATVTDMRTGRQAMVAEGVRTGELILSHAQLSEVLRRVSSDQSGILDESLFVRVYLPPARMVIVGAVHIAHALAPMARLAGFGVIVVDPRAAFARSGDLADVNAMTAWPDEAMEEIKPDARTAIVALTHDPKLDDPALAAALRSPAFYVGALGSRKTHAQRLQRLKTAGFNDVDTARIHGPVGLDINALSPAEIAVSILAQVIQTLRAVP